MNIEKTLCALKREAAGKGPAHRSRAQGLVPGVFYNGKGENILVEVSAKSLEKLYFEIGETTVFNLEIDDKGEKVSHPVLFWAVQKHPYKKRFVSIDYFGVDMDREVTVNVPVEVTGTARGMKLGGHLETYRESVAISAKPLEMPHKIVVDITDLGVNDSVTIDKLALPAGARAVYDEAYTVLAVVSNAKEDEAAEEGAEAPAEAAAK